METIGQKLSLSLANGRLATKVAIFVTAGDGDHHSFLMFVFCTCSVVRAGHHNGRRETLAP